jgi:hypothetical protein
MITYQTVQQSYHIISQHHLRLDHSPGPHPRTRPVRCRLAEQVAEGYAVASGRQDRREREGGVEGVFG